MKLRLFLGANMTNGPKVYVSNNTSWDETTLSHNLQPNYGSTVLGDFTSGTNGNWVEATLTGSGVTGNGIYSFALADDDANLDTFHSREGVNDPQLVISTTPVLANGTACSSNSQCSLSSVMEYSLMWNFRPF